MNAIDVLLAALIVAVGFGVSAYVILNYSSFLAVQAKYLRCFSTALRASDFLLNSTSGLVVTDQSVVIPGRVDCGKLSMAYVSLASRGFNGFVSCGPFSAGTSGYYVVTLRRAAYDVHLGPVTIAVSACPR